MTRRLYPESEMPMTADEYAIFLAAHERHFKKTLKKNPNPARAERFALAVAEAAVVRSRGPQLTAEERTLPLRFNS